MEKHRAARNRDERARHLRWFGDHVGVLDATKVTGMHLKAFQEALKADGHHPDYIKKHVVSVRLFFRSIERRWLACGAHPFDSEEPVGVTS